MLGPSRSASGALSISGVLPSLSVTTGVFAVEAAVALLGFWPALRLNALVSAPRAIRTGLAGRSV